MVKKQARDPQTHTYVKGNKLHRSGKAQRVGDIYISKDVDMSGIDLSLFTEDMDASVTDLSLANISMTSEDRNVMRAHPQLWSTVKNQDTQLSNFKKFIESDVSDVNMLDVSQISFAESSKGSFYSGKMPGKRTTKRSKGGSVRSTGRAGVGAKAIGKRTGYRPLSNVGVHHNVRGFLHPHANSKPRIMDGATAASQTSYLKAIHEFVVPAGRIGVILLTHGATQIAAMKPDNFSGITESITAAAGEIGIDVSAIAATSGQMAKYGSVDRWRMVSRGVKINFLNTSETNDGWFESFRLTDNFGTNDTQITEAPAASNTAYIHPTSSRLDAVRDLSATSAVRMSYLADSLKNISNFYFKLNPFAEEHPFINIPKNFAIQNEGGAVNYIPGPPQSWTFGGSESKTVQPLLNAFHDYTWDEVVIVVHAGASDARLLLDFASNMEIVYENSSTLSRFHQKTTTNSLLTKKLHAASQSSVSAGMSIKTF